MPRINRVTFEVAEQFRDWFDDTRTAYQECIDGKCRVVLSDGTVIFERGANRVFAGGGVCAAWEKHPEGAFDSLKRTFPEGNVMCVGPDGSVLLKPQHLSAGPYDIVMRDRFRWELTKEDLLSPQLLSGGMAVWLGMDRQIRANFEIATPDRLAWSVRYDGGVFLYQDIETGCLVLDGHIIGASGDYFYSDFVWDGGRYLITYSPNQADTSAVTFGITPDELKRLPLVTSPPVIVTPDPVKPPKPEAPVMSFTNHLDTLQRVRAKYPEKITPDQAVAILNEVAWEHKSEGLCLMRKDGGNHGKHASGVYCSCDWLINKITKLGSDVLIAGPDSTTDPVELGPATPTWDDVGKPFDDLSRFVEPVAPDGAVVVDPGTPPTKPPVVTGGTLDADVQKLIAAAIAPLAAKIAALEARPVGGEIPRDLVRYGDHVALRFKSSGKLLCRDEERGNVLQADDRDNAGAWETQTIERGEQG